MPPGKKPGLTVLYCHCGYEKVLNADAQRAVLEELRRRGVEYLAAVDLCGLCARNAELLHRLLSPGAVVIGCHARAVDWLLQWAGLDTRSFTFVNVRTALPPGSQVSDLSAAAGQRPAAMDAGETPASHEGKMPSPLSPVSDAELLGASVLRVQPAQRSADEVIESLNLLVESSHADRRHWFPWFPVIDYSRCTSCGQCRDFCLFGVYAQRDGRVTVAHPSKCKPHCPACAKTCPACAIMFPKHNQPPADGQEVRPEHLTAQLKPEELRKSPPTDLMESLRKRQEAANGKSQIPDRKRTTSNNESNDKEKPSVGSWRSQWVWCLF